MEEYLAFGLFCYVSLFAMVEPLGIMPIYTAMTSGLAPSRQRFVARKACFVAWLVLVIFAIGGYWIFKFFGISVDSLRIVGGVIFFIIGFEMLQARLTRTAYTESESAAGEGHGETPPVKEGDDIALTPLGIPMIAGPGAIANVMVNWYAADSTIKKVILLVCITLVIGSTLLLLIGARRVARFLGDSGNKVLLRLMGLITMVIAVEFFVAGLTPIVQRMLHPPQAG